MAVCNRHKCCIKNTTTAALVDEIIKQGYSSSKCCYQILWTVVKCVETCFIFKYHGTWNKKHYIKEEINWKFQIQCGTALVPCVPMGLFELSALWQFFTDYKTPAAITACGHVKVTGSHLGWLFFLKDATLPYTHAFIIPQGPSSRCGPG
jgi:hypothetical protein